MIESNVRTAQRYAQAPASAPSAPPNGEARPHPILATRNVSFWYGRLMALEGVTLTIPHNQVTAIIGPSGCGKSTYLRLFNRMNEMVRGTRVKGEVLYRGQNVFARNVDPVEVRRQIGMVFQKPNPFPKSIYQNVAYGPKVNGYRGDMDELVERSLRQAALWDRDHQDRGPDPRAAREVHDRDRHSQHAAGRPDIGHDGLLSQQRPRRRRTDRIRRDP